MPVYNSTRSVRHPVCGQSRHRSCSAAVIVGKHLCGVSGDAIADDNRFLDPRDTSKLGGQHERSFQLRCQRSRGAPYALL